MTHKIFWQPRFTKGFKTSFKELCPTEKWRIMGFIRNIAITEKPTEMYAHTPCEKCPPNFFLFGISDDGLGNKGIEIQVWLDEKTGTGWFLRCRKASKP